MCVCVCIHTVGARACVFSLVRLGFTAYKSIEGYLMPNTVYTNRQFYFNEFSLL